MFTYLCVTLHNYQNVLMHKSEHRANPILRIHANKVYELNLAQYSSRNILSKFENFSQLVDRMGNRLNRFDKFSQMVD